jgi:hypothetical protein
MPCCFVIRF